VLKKLFLLIILFYGQTSYANNSFSLTCLNSSDSQKITLQQIANFLPLKIKKSNDKNTLCRELSKQLNETTYISLRNKNITDISPLQFFPRLKKLVLAGNNINDLSPLKTLAYLEELNLAENPIADLSELKTLKKLKKLRISSDKVLDISILESLKNIEFLGLQAKNVKDFSSISSLPQLKSL